MLSEKERDGSMKFLQEFQNHELLSLVETVTSRMVTVRNKQEAISAIVLHSKNALELLRRRKVKKEYIFRHLATQHVAISPTADKSALVRQLLSHWGTLVPEAVGFDQFDETQGNLKERRDNHAQAKGRSASEDSASKEPIHVKALAEQFAAWFYQQLNSLHRATADPTTTCDWGPHHFWDDCKLKLCITSPERRLELFHGSECVAQRFQCFVREEGLMFNPNIGPGGIRGHEEPHGLVTVMVCGTIHRGNECLGLFEQRFGLIRDPHKENNYKVKFIDMNMKQVAVHQMPTLEASTPLAIDTKTDPHSPGSPGCRIS